jgi:aurora kinase
LKKISKKEIKNNNMMTQISNEIQISKRLEHPNIIKLYEYFDDENDIFLVLELARGGQLYQKLMKVGRFDE